MTAVGTEGWGDQNEEGARPSSEIPPRPQDVEEEHSGTGDSHCKGPEVGLLLVGLTTEEPGEAGWVEWSKPGGAWEMKAEG